MASWTVDLHITEGHARLAESSFVGRRSEALKGVMRVVSSPEVHDDPFRPQA